MSDKSFFKEPKEQSLVKARIAVKYFWAWATIIAAKLAKKERGREKLKLAYIDLFAGPGRYDNGSESTPLLIFKKAIETPKLQERLLTVFNDKDLSYTQALKENIQNIPDINLLKNPPIITNHEINENNVNELLNQLDISLNERSTLPTLLFLDPFGYKGLSRKLIKSFVVEGWGCDCLLFFNFNIINRDLSTSSVQHHMEAIFGVDRHSEMKQRVKSLQSEEREEFIMSSFYESLKEVGVKNITKFRFQSYERNRTSHYLIFISNNKTAHKIIKDIMAKESAEEEQGVASFEHKKNEQTSGKQLSLFPEFEDDKPKPLDELKNSLLDKFAGKNMTMKKVFEKHHPVTTYTEKNYKSALKKLEEEGKIICKPPANQRRKGTFGDKVEVTFPAKPSN